MTIKIISEGLFYQGAPLPVDQLNNFDAATEAMYVATGKAVYDPIQAFAGERKSPYILAQSGSAVVLLPSGTVDASGTFTLGVALPYQPTGVVQVYVFAGVGLTAGLYLATFSSTTVCTLVGNPATTAGAYAGGTTEATLATLTVPGGIMGPNGALRIQSSYGFATSANAKTLRCRLGGSAFAQIGPTTTTAMSGGFILRNRNNPALQVRVGGTAAASFGAYSGVAANGASIEFTIDTAKSQPLTFTGQLANAADFIILDGYTVEVLPS